MLFDLPKQEKSIIKVIGVGGGGGNAVGHMFLEGIKGVDFAVCNTDSQALDANPVGIKIQLGPHLTEGRGAGTKPEIGKQACIESIDEVRQFLNNGTKMLFITAGMGGGTGTGAAPIIAKAAKEMDILTVGIITIPFKFEGLRRQRHALEGLEDLKNNVDAILVISNDKMKEIHGNLPISEAFAEADDILTTAAKGIAEIITVPGYVNVDFEDVNTVMRDSGVAIMGTAIAEGEGRAQKAIHQALNSPLLEDNDIRGAQHILLNITSGIKEVTMDEIGEITEYVQEEAGYGTDLIWGNCKDEAMGEKLSITLIATGFEEGFTEKLKPKEIKKIVPLDGDEYELTEDKGFSRGVVDGESTHTYDFDVKTRNLEPVTAKYFVQKEPYEKSNPKKNTDENTASKFEIEAARRKQLRNNVNKPIDNPKIINELENEPAYKRRNVDLEINKGSGDNGMTKYTVSMDEDNPIQRSNQYLHDNVD